ncbi:MAG: nucleoside recognition domain-containing protein [Bacteroidota bacterium]
MLNYIWLTLLFLGIGVGLTTDILNETSNKYMNGEPLYVIVKFETDDIDSTKTNKAKIFISSTVFNEFYRTGEKDTIWHSANLTFNKSTKNFAMFLETNDSSPRIWKEMSTVNGKENDLTGRIILRDKVDPFHYTATLFLENISFIKMKSVTNAAIDYAANAVKIALGLIGIMALWLGIMKIAEESGLIKVIAKSVKPVTKFLFPDVPHDHPAIGSMIMNISANMLGLGNAATPFGLKAMEELDSINPTKGIATNAMCTFLAINTAGLTLIPATAIAIRASAGSSDPTIIIGTSFFGALCATLTGITAAKVLEKFSIPNFNFRNWIKSNLKFLVSFFFSASVIILLFLSGALSIISAETVKSIIQVVSTLAIPLIIFFFIIYGVIRNVKIYEVFVEGAKEGFNIAVRIIPFLVAMLVAIGIFRTGGAMDYLIIILSPITNLIGMPAEAMPMALMRPLSGSGSLGIMSEIISVHGPDSFLGILVSTIMGSTETTFYVLALYFGAVNIKKTRHAVAAGVLADIAGILAALFIVRLIFH